jgi:hypothetical protein
MSASPKKKRGPTKTALQTFKLPLRYHALSFVQFPFAWVFWLIEQRKSRIHDGLANERSGK